MKKLTSILMLAALASSAVALSEGQSFAKSRPSHARHAVVQKARKSKRATSKTRKARAHARKSKRNVNPALQIG